MAKRIGGFYWHVHHYSGPVPLEYCYDYEGRRRVIVETKPPEEQPVRLARFASAEWPDMPKDVREAGAELNAAWVNLSAAEAKLNMAGVELNAAWDKWDAVLLKYAPEILRLHAEQCKGCLWSETTDIFGKAV